MAVPAVAFSAYSGTGKTTLIEKLIPCLKSSGLRVAVIKHDAHHFEIDHEGKDSWRFAQAGADTVILSSAEKTALVTARQFSLNELLAQVQDVDLILVEGYKNTDLPRIGLFRSGAETGLTDELGNFLAVASDVKLENCPVPCFDLNEAESIAAFLIKTLLK